MSLRRDIESVINRNSCENGSNTPDFILAEYLERCLNSFDAAVAARERWYGRPIVGPAGCHDSVEIEEIVVRNNEIGLMPDGA